MINRLLRRLTVRRRIVGGFLILLFLLALSIPLIVANQFTLSSRLRHITDVEARADRLLLLAAARVSSSRVNTMRYIADYSPSLSAATDDIELTAQYLTEAQELITTPEQQAVVTGILEGLTEYRTLLDTMQAAHQEGRDEEVASILFQAYRLERDLGQRIEQTVHESEVRVQAANAQVYAEATQRLLILVAGYAAILMLALALAGLLQRSISGPVAELRSAAEAFLQGEMEVSVPVVGSDELSLLAQTFNQMAAQLHASFDVLEQRVAERTRELEVHSGYLEAAAAVGHAATSILDADVLIQRIVELIREWFDLYYVGLFRLDDAGEWAVLHAGTGEAGMAMLARGHRIRVGEGMIGWSVANDRTRVALEAGEDAVRLATAELPETRSEAALPLSSRGRVLGALTIQSSQPGAFGPDTIIALEAMADLVAVGLDNAMLFAESQRTLEAAREAYGQLSREGWARFLRAHPELGYLCDENGVRATDARRSALLQTAQAKRAVVLDGRTAVLPIKAGGQAVGAVRLRKPDDAEDWTDAEANLLETLVDQLSLALEGARLYEESQRHAAQERLVGEISARMRTTLDLDTVLQTAAQEMREALGLPEVVVRLAPHPAGVAPQGEDIRGQTE